MFKQKLILMILFSFILPKLALSKAQCRFLLEDQHTLNWVETIENLENPALSKDTADEAIAILVDSITRFSFKLGSQAAFVPAKNILTQRARLTSKETLLLAILEFNIENTSYVRTANIRTAINILESISVPVRRNPLYIWHQAEFYSKLGDSESRKKALNLLSNIVGQNNRLSPKTLSYFYHLYRELGQPPLSSQVMDALRRVNISSLTLPVAELSDWGPYESGDL